MTHIDDLPKPPIDDPPPLDADDDDDDRERFPWKSTITIVAVVIVALWSISGFAAGMAAASGQWNNVAYESDGSGECVAYLPASRFDRVVMSSPAFHVALWLFEPESRMIPRCP